MTQKGQGLVTIVVNLEPDAWHGYGTETVWAEKVGGNRYRLRNTPFYAFGVSAEDVVFAEPDDEARLVFSSVSLRGGHSTYRIIRAADREEMLLDFLGTSCETRLLVRRGARSSTCSRCSSQG